jgi:Skp family chaperone for outer membrane proteins
MNGLLRAGGVFILADLVCLGLAVPKEHKPLARPRIAIVNLPLVIKNYKKCASFEREIEDYTARIQQEKDEMQELMAKVAKMEDRWAIHEVLKPDELNKLVRWSRRDYREEFEARARDGIARMRDDHSIILYRDLRQAVEQYAKARDIELVLTYNNAREQTEVSPHSIQSSSPDRMDVAPCKPIFAALGVDISVEIAATMNAAWRNGLPR